MGFAGPVAGLLFLAATPATAGSEWRFSIEPYILATSIEGDASIGRASNRPVDVGFDG